MDCCQYRTRTCSNLPHLPPIPTASPPPPRSELLLSVESQRPTSTAAASTFPWRQYGGHLWHADGQAGADCRCFTAVPVPAPGPTYGRCLTPARRRPDAMVASFQPQNSTGTPSALFRFDRAFTRSQALLRNNVVQLIHSLVLMSPTNILV